MISYVRDKAMLEIELVRAIRDGKPTNEIEGKIERIINLINHKTGAKEYRDKEENSVVMKIKKSYSNDCMILEQKGFTNHKEYTVFEFYDRLDFIKNTTPKK